MKQSFLAIDIGASSGRHFLGSLDNNNALSFKEIYRFPNGLVNKNNHLCWDLNALFNHIKEGLIECRKKSGEPLSIGIDTWGCDFVLLDKEYNLIGDSVSYRDSRTDGYPEKISKYISPDELYKRTGTQFQKFNTIFQLMSIKENKPEELSKAQYFLMIPDYFNFLLTGIPSNEYTNATTTSLVNAESKNWDYELIEKLGLPSHIFLPLKLPGEKLGKIKNQIAGELGFTCDIVVPPTHDTASAVAALPCPNEDFPLYISSGTWSLLGTELSSPITSKEAQKANYTNEGGFNKSIRFLKNIMGLWMIQSVKKECEKTLSKKIPFDVFDTEAENAAITSIIDCNDSVFLAPDSMSIAIKNYCFRNGLQAPDNYAETAKVVYRSLAQSYKNAIKELEAITGIHFSTLHIIGGGSRSKLLNKLTQEATVLEIKTGPAEATAIGNCIIQMLSAGLFESLNEARSTIKKYLENGGN